MAKRGPGNPYHDKETGEFTSGPGGVAKYESDDDILTQLAMKHDPEGYARMKAIKSIADAIKTHQKKNLKKGDSPLPKGTYDSTGFHPDADYVDSDIGDRMQKIKDLIARPGTPGEKKAAQAALKRMQRQK